MERTVVALFDDVNSAQRALEELLNNGFDRSDISVVRTNAEGGVTAGTTTTDDMDTSGAAAGAGIGAALGGIAGLVVGLGVLAIPGIGPIVAAGPLATTLAGAGIGAAAGGIIGALTDVGIPESEAGYYVEGVRRGGTLLTVRASENQVSRATEVLNRFSPVNINERSAEWRSSGWSGFDPNASAHTGTTSSAYSSATESGIGGATMGMSTSMGASTSDTGLTGMGTGSTSFSGTPTKSASQYEGMGTTGDFRANRFDDFDNDFRSDWQTRYASKTGATSGYGYERYQPAYRYGFESRNRYRGRNWSDVESDLRSDWQRNHPSDRWEDFKDSIKTGWDRFKHDVSDTTQDMRQGAREMGRDMERGFDRTTRSMSRTFDDYDRDFRTDWEQSFRSHGYGYERFQPAYRYGHSLATENRYRGRNWNDIEADARRDWETRHPSEAWDDFKDAVRHAWQRVRADVRDAID